MRLLLSLLFVLSLSTSSQATIIVVTHLTDDTDDNNGTCNFREAIEAANDNVAVDACPAGRSFEPDEIFFAKTGRIELIQTLPQINYDVVITGPGPEYLTIDANGFGRVLYFSDASSGSPQFFFLSGMTITGGESTTSGGGIFQAFNSGHTTISDVVITGNKSANGGGMSGSRFTLRRVTIDDNEATSGSGGGLAVSVNGNPESFIYDSTISNNISNSFGGGIEANGAKMTIRRSTISGNSSNNGGGGIYRSGNAVEDYHLDIAHSTVTNNTCGVDLGFANGCGINIANNGELTIKNTIVAGNIDSAGDDTPDIFANTLAVVNSSGYNFIGDRSGATSHFAAGLPNANNEWVGDSSARLIPGITALIDHSGPTLIHLPTTAMGDNVIDIGSCPGEETDQEGNAGNTSIPIRPKDITTIPDADDGCDIGAVETSSTRVPVADFGFQLLLDGPYTNVLMSSGLSDNSLIPANQPYNTAPWDYAGQENLNTSGIPVDMVDWIYVEFYQGAPGDGVMDLKFRRVFYLENNGDLKVPDNFTDVKINPGQYHIAIYHRNHLPIVSNFPVFLVGGETAEYDFRRSMDAAFSSGGSAMRDRGNDYFTMWGGDGDSNESVSAFDFLNIWLPANGGAPSYSGADFNMDGLITAFDFLNTWLPANGQTSQLP